ncbi:uncharacterized protein LOC134267900 [Saccostrea cucullata]|uniref:uncharacterized protein LOC134267900 n=1 Tax=Saccostrea cuccullata TaxID=36930 RepID=UPI002ECFF6D6
MSRIVQVSEAEQRENFVKTHPVVTWTFGADVESNLSSDRRNLTSSTYVRLSTSRSQESEDSGVKSASNSHNEDEAPVSPTSSASEDTKRRRSILRKLSTSSGLSLRSHPSSPLFDFPTFEELFEGKGTFKLTRHHSKPYFSRQQSYPGPAEAVLDENADDTGISLTATEEKPKLLKRVDSTMCQSFSSLVHGSWKGSKGFRGYRKRLGNALHHRYCMCCRFESTLFIGLYCIVGLFLSSSGIVCYMTCPDEILVSCYLTVDGILSVFVFPILVMGWTKRVGGCVGDTEDVGTGTFWISVFILRILLTASGTFVCIYRYYMEKPVWTSTMCQFEFYALLGGIVFEWIFCVTVIFLPMCFYCLFYCFAPSFGVKSGSYTINVKEQK